VKCIAEVRFLLVSVTLFAALVVPVAAATFGSDANNEVPAAGDAPSIASATLLIESAPPPLIFLALGTLLVVSVVGRRARRAPVEPLADESDLRV
jgi:hypothetical protein